MNPDQTALSGAGQTAPLGAIWSGFNMFALCDKISLEGIWIYAADVISRQQFFNKKI